MDDLTLDHHIESFSHASFSLEKQTKGFFAKQSGSEFQNGVREAALAQGRIGQILQEKVLLYYPSLMHLNTQAAVLGQDLGILSRSVQDASGRIHTALQHCETITTSVPESNQPPVARRPTLSALTGTDPLWLDSSIGIQSSEASGGSSGPNAMELLVERRYHDVIALLRQPSKAAGISNGDSLSPTVKKMPYEHLREVGKENDRKGELVSKLVMEPLGDQGALLDALLDTSVRLLPSSRLWGARERERRLAARLALDNPTGAVVPFLREQSAVRLSVLM
jgi:hypothetical protein